MGAAAATQLFQHMHGEEVASAFAEVDENHNGVIEEIELRQLVADLVAKDEILRGCGPTDIEELTTVILRRFAGPRRALNAHLFSQLYQEALVDKDKTREFLRMSWSALGIQRMKEAQKEWKAASGIGQIPKSQKVSIRVS